MKFGLVSKLQFHDHPNSRIGQEQIPIPNSLPEYRHPNEPQAHSTYGKMIYSRFTCCHLIYQLGFSSHQTSFAAVSFGKEEEMQNLAIVWSCGMVSVNQNCLVVWGCISISISTTYNLHLYLHYL
jgi:hypothetical protein